MVSQVKANSTTNPIPLETKEQNIKTFVQKHFSVIENHPFDVEFLVAIRRNQSISSIDPIDLLTTLEIMLEERSEDHPYHFSSEVFRELCRDEALYPFNELYMICFELQQKRIGAKEAAMRLGFDKIIDRFWEKTFPPEKISLLGNYFQWLDIPINEYKGFIQESSLFEKYLAAIEPEGKDQKGYTLLHHLAKRSHGIFIKKALSKYSKGYQVETENKKTLLHMVCKIGSMLYHQRCAFAEDLIKEMHLDINAKTFKGRTPLMIAIKHTDDKLAARLIEWGAKDEDNVYNYKKFCKSFNRSTEVASRLYFIGFMIFSLLALAVAAWCWKAHRSLPPPINSKV